MDLYRRLIDTFIRENGDGTISMTSCCSVAGLGGKQMRKGDYAYYLSEPVIDNDCKGVGPFIWASLEYEAMNNIDYRYDGRTVRDGVPVIEGLWRSGVLLLTVRLEEECIRREDVEERSMS